MSGADTGCKVGGGGAWVQKSSSLSRCQQLTSTKKINSLILWGGGDFRGGASAPYSPSKSASACIVMCTIHAVRYRVICSQQWRINAQASIGCSLGAHTDQGPLIGQEKKGSN